MANSDKNILITPNRNASGIPEIAFTGFGNTAVSIEIPDDSLGTIEFKNKASGNRLLSISNDVTLDSQFIVGKSIVGNELQVDNFNSIDIKTKRTIVSGNGIKLPRVKANQSIPRKGKLAYDHEQNTLIVGDSTHWVNYGSTKEGYIKNGLILHYDPSRKESYPGSGSLVYDISGSSNGNGGEFTGTLVNVGYSDARGAFTFNGSNSYIDISNSISMLRDLCGYTVEWYVKSTTNTAAEIFGNYGTSNSTNYLWISARYGHYLNTSNPYFVSTVYTPAAPLPSESYVYHGAVTRDQQTRNTSLYLNGVLNNLSSANTNIAEGQLYRIGLDVNSSNAEPFGGDLYVIRVYNRALSPKEIQMNFDATRERVGL